MKYTIFLINGYTDELVGITSISCNQYIMTPHGIYYHEDANAKMEVDNSILNLDGFGFIPMANVSNIKPNKI